MLEIKTKAEGAELTSIKFNGIEKLHDGLADWNRQSPVLFPTVGKLRDGKNIIEGQECFMGQHGFARDMVFEQIGDNYYVLRYNDETLSKYPYKFELYISYETTEDEVITRYRVVNVDDKPIYFGLGAHPAFVCDYGTGKYSIVFDDIENESLVYQLDNGLVKEFPENRLGYIRENRIFLGALTFNKDAIIIKNIKSRRIHLKTEVKTVLTMNLENFKHLGIWSKPGAHFICLEPWYTHADRVNSDGIFEHKEDIIRLEQGQEFNASWSVKFYY